MRDCPSHTGHTVVYLERCNEQPAISFRILLPHALRYFHHMMPMLLPRTHVDFNFLSMQN